MTNQRKATHITRKNYYLTLEDKMAIRSYAHANPHLTRVQVGEHFGVSRTTVTNVSKIPYRKEHYDKMIFELTNLKNQMSGQLFKLELEVRYLQNKLKQYESTSPTR